MKNEIQSRAYLKDLGFDATIPGLATSPETAAKLAGSLSGPLALKVVSPDLVHKAAAGGVALGVGALDVPSVYASLLEAVRASRPDARIEGVLIEEMVPPGREVFIGGRLDDQFGPLVLIGPGGSGVEQGIPPCIALAPLGRATAEDLVDRALPHATVTPEERAILVAYVLALAGPNGALVTRLVGEIDINPIIVGGGRAVVVDAVIHGGRGETWGESRIAADAERRRARLGGLDALFEPESIAVVGASNASGKLGYRLVRNLLDFGYRGTIYPIHPTADEICGLPAFPTVDAIPVPVDRALIAIGSAHVPDALRRCAARGVKVAQVLTAGYSEWTGDQQSSDAAAEREAEIRVALSGTDMRLVGPNCIGTFSASRRMTVNAPRYCPTEPGGITFISQSGTFAGDVVRRAQVQGLPVARVLSCGNCLDLDAVDYLLFCQDDPSTEVIALYLESVHEPGLFFRLAERSTKPIVLLKGGTTDRGLEAASSHTAALSADPAVWTAGVRQAGILQVDGIDALLDALLIHTAHKELRGSALAIFGSGGGVSVTSSDAAARAGLTIPALSPQTAGTISRFGVPGTSLANPIDIPVWGLRENGKFILDEIADTLKADPGVDSIICYIEVGSIMDFADSEEDGRQQLAAICSSIRKARRDGPQVSLVLRSSGDQMQDDLVRTQRRTLLAENIAVFGSTAQAVRAHAALLRMTRRRLIDSRLT